MSFDSFVAGGRLVPTKHAFAQFVHRWKTTPSPNDPIGTMIKLIRRSRFSFEDSEGACEYVIDDWSFILAKHTNGHGEYLTVVTCYRHEEKGKNRCKQKYRKERAREKLKWRQGIVHAIYADD